MLHIKSNNYSNWLTINELRNKKNSYNWVAMSQEMSPHEAKSCPVVWQYGCRYRHVSCPGAAGWTGCGSMGVVFQYPLSYSRCLTSPVSLMLCKWAPAVFWKGLITHCTAFLSLVMHRPWQCVRCPLRVFSLLLFSPGLRCAIPWQVLCDADPQELKAVHQSPDSKTQRHWRSRLCLYVIFFFNPCFEKVSH